MTRRSITCCTRKLTKRRACWLCLWAVVAIVAYSMLLNVHISRPYVLHQAHLYPANITIERRCAWANARLFDFHDYKPKSHVLISKMMSIVYRTHGIIPILRNGAFLHAYRELSADVDIDLFLIVPRTITIWNAYAKIRAVIKSNVEFRDITLVTGNILQRGLFFDKSDTARMKFNGEEYVDINVLHETFLNDPDLQTPCMRGFDCRKHIHEYNDAYLTAIGHHITTKTLFESLCECNYMDSVLVCFNLHAAKFLEVKYGRNFTNRIPGANGYFFNYERPTQLWMTILKTSPALTNLRRAFTVRSEGPGGLAYTPETEKTLA